MIRKAKKPSETASRAGNRQKPDTGGRLLYAIGDVHGRLDLLDVLLQRIADDAGDRHHDLVFLGDYVDRGPDSWGVIERLTLIKKKRPSTLFLKGNHEQVMLDFLADPEDNDSWLDWGGLETLQSYGISSVRGHTLEDLRDKFADLLPDAHFRFLLDLPVVAERGDYIFVHAGVAPDLPLKQQREQDLLWIRARFLEDTGNAWRGRTIVHGHTPVESAQDHGWRINVDSGAYASGILTAVKLDGQKRQFLST